MPENVYDLKEKLKEFKAFLPQFKNYSAYGTLAALKYDGSSDKYECSLKSIFVAKLCVG